MKEQMGKKQQEPVQHHCIPDDAGIHLRGMVTWSLRGRWTLWYPWTIVVIQMLMIIYLLSLVDPARMTRRCMTQESLQTQNYVHLEFDERIYKEISPTVFGSHDRMFYNRVPKCGSSSLMDVIIEMGIENNFTFARSPVYMTFYMDPEFRANLVDSFMRTPAPLLYERHLHFMEFNRYGGQQPMYINLIRDPLDRLVSFYYFRRYQSGHIREMPTNQRARSYDACVLGNYSECVDPMGNDAEEGYFKIIPFFCGQDEYCRTPSEKSLIQAIQNVKRNYIVVGLLEKYPEFIEALEYTVPSFFKGASLVYKKLEDELVSKHKTTYKLPVSNDVRALMYPKLQYEYQFYNFIQNRFQKLSQRIQNARSKFSES